MEALHISAPLLFISSRSINYSLGEQTVYEGCKHMPAAFIWYLSLQAINMFLGLPANIMVLWLIHKNKGDSSTSDIFIQNLAVVDIIFCVTIPLEVTTLVFLTTSSTWYVLSFVYGIKDSSPIFLSCICLDRYMAVLHPIKFNELKDQQHRAVLVSVVWIITLAYAAAKCVGTIVDFETFVYSAMLLAVFAFMVFCNIAILRALRQSGPARDDMHPVKKRAFNMVIIILAIIVCHYFPLVALLPFKSYFSPDVHECYVRYFAFGLMDISSSIQPVLYLSKVKLTCGSGLCCKSKIEQHD